MGRSGWLPASPPGAALYQLSYCPMYRPPGKASAAAFYVQDAAGCTPFAYPPYRNYSNPDVYHWIIRLCDALGVAFAGGSCGSPPQGSGIRTKAYCVVICPLPSLIFALVGWWGEDGSNILMLGRKDENPSATSRPVWSAGRVPFPALRSFPPSAKTTRGIRLRRHRSAAGGQSRIRTGFLPLCLRVCFRKHLLPVSPPPMGGGRQIFIP